MPEGVMPEMTETKERRVQTIGVYVTGWIIGLAFGTSLFRAVESGGEWWLFPPVLAVFSVAWIWSCVR
jgi:hypothetical protein